MDKKLFERLVESMQQHEEIRRGERAPSREFFVDAEKVKEIRTMTGLSQTKFARLLDVDVGTLRNWEQGRWPPCQVLFSAIHDFAQSRNIDIHAFDDGGHTVVPAQHTNVESAGNSFTSSIHRATESVSRRRLPRDRLSLGIRGRLPIAYPH